MSFAYTIYRVKASAQVKFRCYLFNLNGFLFLFFFFDFFCLSMMWNKNRESNFVFFEVKMRRKR